MPTKKITQYSGEPINLESIAEAVRYLGPKVLGKRFWEKYNFWFRIVHLPGDLDGQCWKIRNQIHIRIDHRLSFIDTVICLAHELVHAKQYLSGRLKSVPNTEDGKWVWKGKKYNDCDYENDPWEREAKSREHILAKQFFDYSIKKIQNSDGRLTASYIKNASNRQIIL